MLYIIAGDVRQGFDEHSLIVLYYCGAALTIFALCTGTCLLAWPLYLMDVTREWYLVSIGDMFRVAEMKP